MSDRVGDHISEPARIEDDLGRTRARLDERLDELMERLSPGQVLDEALAYIRHGEGSDFTRNLAESVREKPVPAALVGIGLAWLMATGGSGPRGSITYGRTTYVRPRPGSEHHELVLRVRQAGDALTRSTGETEEGFNTRIAEARGTVMGLTRNAQETAQSFIDRVQQAFSDAQTRATEAAQHGMDRMRDAAGNMGDAMSGAGHRMSDTLGQGVQQGREAMRHMGGDLLGSLGEHPLVLGALGVAAGAMLGAILPRSELEDEYLGDTAARARHAVEEQAGDLAERGRHVAEAVVSAGRDAVREQGGNLSGRSVQDLAGAARDAGQKVVQAGKEAAQREGMMPGGQDRSGSDSSKGRNDQSRPDQSRPR